MAISNLSTAVHLDMSNSDSKLEANPPLGQAYPLFENENQPFNTSDDYNDRIINITKTINFLNVSEPSHKRYQPNNGLTYCNIYAYDFCYLMGSKINKYYIPRVWWNNDIIPLITDGIPKTPEYKQTVNELTANDLFDWFNSYGLNFGWVTENNVDDLQNYVNSSGEIGIIVGKKLHGHGHITVVVPEQSAYPLGSIKATRNQIGKVINPLQSQAGTYNFKFGNSEYNGEPWFTNGHVSSFYRYIQPLNP